MGSGNVCIEGRGRSRFVGCAILRSRKLYSLFLTLPPEVLLGHLLVLKRPHQHKRLVRVDSFLCFFHSLNAADFDILHQCA